MPALALSLALSLSSAASPPASPRAAAAALAPLDALWPDLDALYQDLHRTPELSGQEERTAAKMAARLRATGFEVTERVGGHGVVGVLRNGKGPTLLVRTDLDGLPVQERTGLPYASTATATAADGRTVSVMHACGHDVHMSGWIAAATLLSRARDAWRGTLVFVGQPAEETGSGAAAMLADGLFARFGRPDFAIAVHDAADMPAGTVGFVPGWALANVDSVDVTFFGRGGHGAYPHRTVDPIVMAARFVGSVQTVVSREQDPTVPAVVTVGSFQAGTKHNVIPDEARLQLTVRCLFTPGMRATVTVPGTGQAFPAAVSQVLPQFEAATRTLRVRLEMRNPGFVLRPDMFVDVELPIEVGPGLFLPREAVLDSGTRQVVFVEQVPGVFAPRAVRTGRRFGDRVEIVAGLMEGETVVTSGNFLLDSESRMRAAGAAAAGEVSLDPICGMEVEEAKARAQGLASEHGGKDWFFCSAGCIQAFERDPAAAAAKALGIPQSDPAVPPPAAAVPPAGTVGAPPAEPHRAMVPGGHAGMPTAPRADEEEATPEGMHEHSGMPPPDGMPEDMLDQGPEGGPVGWQRPLPVPRDPVCGMEVDVSKAIAEALVSEHGSKTFYFCTPACKKEFDEKPAVFIQTGR